MDLKKQIQDIDSILEVYKEKMVILNDKRNKIIKEFSDYLKNKKIEDIKKSLNTK